MARIPLLFEEILRLSSIRGFFNFSTKLEEMQYGPVGYLLRENLKTEWLHSNADVNVFLNMKSETLSNCFDFVKNLCREHLPFGLIHMESNSDPMGRNKGKENEIDKYFEMRNQLKLETVLFVDPSNSAQVFYTRQRQRRMWWRKISASPGRYALSDIQINPNGEQNIEIISTYPWGSYILETIRLLPNGNGCFTEEQLNIKIGRKQIKAHCIINTTYLSTMVLNTICDAYDEPLFKGAKRPLLRFHRKIAPYKISFAIATTSTTNRNDLNDLSLYLYKQLRNNNVSVLLLPNISRTNLETQWSQYDELGVPYTVVLNEKSLKDGIVYLRSRDTTLKEQVHVSDLSGYVEKLFKNY